MLQDEFASFAIIIDIVFLIGLPEEMVERSKNL